ncbi:EI24 domain-containing protein, partial [Klebsiella pneumoniae]|uniref:EI24 domain-containing protein n=1 Tax=Klebsiella pneumoniae TaxID=573 RepID=UPI0040557C26
EIILINSPFSLYRRRFEVYIISLLGIRHETPAAASSPLSQQTLLYLMDDKVDIELSRRPAMRAALRRHKVANLQFGALVSLFTLIPVVNLVILP